MHRPVVVIKNSNCDLLLYKCIGIELDLFPQLTTKNSLYVYYCKHGNSQIESTLPFQSSTQCT